MAIRHNRRPTQAELERVFFRWIYFHLRSKIFFWLSYGGKFAPIVPTRMDPPLAALPVFFRRTCAYDFSERAAAR